MQQASLVNPPIKVFTVQKNPSQALNEPPYKKQESKVSPMLDSPQKTMIIPTSSHGTESLNKISSSKNIISDARKDSKPLVTAEEKNNT